MYKDKDKQREANRKAQARFKAKGITDKELEDAKGITNEGITQGVTVIPLTAEQIDKDVVTVPPKRVMGVIPNCQRPIPKPPKPQSHNPMMVGYVPPQD